MAQDNNNKSYTRQLYDSLQVNGANMTKTPEQFDSAMVADAEFRGRMYDALSGIQALPGGNIERDEFENRVLSSVKKPTQEKKKDNSEGFFSQLWGGVKKAVKSGGDAMSAANTAMVAGTSPSRARVVEARTQPKPTLTPEQEKQKKQDLQVASQNFGTEKAIQDYDWQKFTQTNKERITGQQTPYPYKLQEEGEQKEQVAQTVGGGEYGQAVADYVEKRDKSISDYSAEIKEYADLANATIDDVIAKAKTKYKENEAAINVGFAAAPAYARFAPSEVNFSKNFINAISPQKLFEQVNALLDSPEMKEQISARAQERGLTDEQYISSFVMPQFQNAIVHKIEKELQIKPGLYAIQKAYDLSIAGKISRGLLRDPEMNKMEDQLLAEYDSSIGEEALSFALQYGADMPVYALTGKAGKALTSKLLMSPASKALATRLGASVATPILERMVQSGTAKWALNYGSHALQEGTTFALFEGISNLAEQIETKPWKEKGLSALSAKETLGSMFKGLTMGSLMGASKIPLGEYSNRMTLQGGRYFGRIAKSYERPWLHDASAWTGRALGKTLGYGANLTTRSGIMAGVGLAFDAANGQEITLKSAGEQLKNAMVTNFAFDLTGFLTSVAKNPSQGMAFMRMQAQPNMRFSEHERADLLRAGIEGKTEYEQTLNLMEEYQKLENKVKANTPQKEGETSEQYNKRLSMAVSSELSTYLAQHNLTMETMNKAIYQLKGQAFGMLPTVHSEVQKEGDQYALTEYASPNLVNRRTFYRTEEEANKAKAEVDFNGSIMAGAWKNAGIIETANAQNIFATAAKNSLAELRELQAAEKRYKEVHPESAERDEAQAHLTELETAFEQAKKDFAENFPEGTQGRKQARIELRLKEQEYKTAKAEYDKQYPESKEANEAKQALDMAQAKYDQAVERRLGLLYKFSRGGKLTAEEREEILAMHDSVGLPIYQSVESIVDEVLSRREIDGKVNKEALMRLIDSEKPLTRADYARLNKENPRLLEAFLATHEAMENALGYTERYQDAESQRLSRAKKNEKIEDFDRPAAPEIPELEGVDIPAVDGERDVTEEELPTGLKFETDALYIDGMQELKYSNDHLMGRDDSAEAMAENLKELSSLKNSMAEMGAGELVAEIDKMMENADLSNGIPQEVCDRLNQLQNDNLKKTFSAYFSLRARTQGYADAAQMDFEKKVTDLVTDMQDKDVVGENGELTVIRYKGKDYYLQSESNNIYTVLDAETGDGTLLPKREPSIERIDTTAEEYARAKFTPELDARNAETQAILDAHAQAEVERATAETISSHRVEESASKKETQNSKVLHLKENKSLSSDGYLTETPREEGSDLVPTPDNTLSDGKDIKLFDNQQEKEEIIPTKSVKVDSTGNAIIVPGETSADMLRSHYERQLEGLDKSLWPEAIDGEVDAAVKELEKAKRAAQPTRAKCTSMADYVAKQKAWETNIKTAEAKVNLLRETRDKMFPPENTGNGEGASFQGENGEVVDVSKDTPSAARERGFIMVNGEKVERLTPLTVEDGMIEGKTTEVVFSNDQEGKEQAVYVLLPISRVAQSHRNGQPVTEHYFLSDSQPKGRTDMASQNAATSIGENLDIRIIEGTTAYDGAPVINERGEVIQGNNRKSGLEQMTPEAQAKYKQLLIENAGKLGFTKEQIAEAVDKGYGLFRKVSASDARAVELGQYEAGDVESGGERAIKPKNVVGKLTAKGQLGDVVSMLFRGGDESTTLATFMRLNGKDVIDQLYKLGAIDQTQYQNALNAGGKLTPEGKKALNGLLDALIVGDSPQGVKDAVDELTDKRKAVLATALGIDAKADKKNSLSGDIRTALAYLGMLNDAGIDVSKLDANGIRRAVGELFAQTNAFEANMVENKTATEMLVNILKGKPEDFLTRLRDYYGKTAKQEAGLFETVEPLSREEALKEVFGVEPKEKDSEPEHFSVEENSETEKKDVSLQGEKVNQDEQGILTPEQTEQRRLAELKKAGEEYKAAVEEASRIEQEWRDKIADYVAEKYPTQATTTAETTSEKGLAEREAMRNDATLKKMREDAARDWEEADKKVSEALAKENALAKDESEKVQFSAEKDPQQSVEPIDEHDIMGYAERVVRKRDQETRTILEEEAKRLEGSGLKFHIFNDLADVRAQLGDRIADSLESLRAQGKVMPAWHTNGNLYFVVSDMRGRNPKRYVAEKIFHEAVQHEGMRRILGDKFTDFMCQVWRDLMDGVSRERKSEYVWENNYVTRPASRAEAFFDKKVTDMTESELAEGQEIATKHWKDLTAEEKERVQKNADFIASAADEWSASAFEKIGVQKPDLFGKIADAVRNFLRKMGFDIKLTDRQLMNWQSKAYDKLMTESGDIENNSEDAHFSAEDGANIENKFVNLQEKGRNEEATNIAPNLGTSGKGREVGRGTEGREIRQHRGLRTDFNSYTSSDRKYLAKENGLKEVAVNSMPSYFDKEFDTHGNKYTSIEHYTTPKGSSIVVYESQRNKHYIICQDIDANSNASVVLHDEVDMTTGNRYWTAILNSDNSPNFKDLLSSSMSLIPDGDIFCEQQSASLQGIRSYLGQLDHGFSLISDASGQLLTRTILLNDGDFETNFDDLVLEKEGYAEVEKYIKGLYKKAGVPECKVYFKPIGNGETGRIVFEIPMLEKQGSDAQKTANPADGADKSWISKLRDKLQFSVESPIEETRDLVAMHNLDADVLKKALDLGGLPMPSIAITKKDMGHNEFGDVSLVFGKDTINPTDRRNKIYSGDAWTPTFPEIDFKLSDRVAYGIRDKVTNLLSDYDYLSVYNTPLDRDNMHTKMRSSKNFKDSYKDETIMKIAFLKDKGISFRPVLKEKVYDSRYGNETLRRIIDEVGNGDLKAIYQLPFDKKMEVEPALREIVDDYKRAKVEETLQSLPEEKRGDNRLIQLLSKDIGKELSFSEVDNLLHSAYTYQLGGDKKIVDTNATTTRANKKFTKKLQSEYEDWLDELSDGVIEKYGIRNETDLFTPMGNRRSWEALHNSVTLNNIVLAMKSQAAKGGNGLFGGNPFGAAQKDINSISDLHEVADKNVREIPPEDYEAYKQAILDKLSRIHIPGIKRDFEGMMTEAELITGAIKKSHEASGIYKYIKRYYPDMTMDAAKAIEGIVSDIQAMPTKYLEAKPQRAVGFDEVKMALVPRGTDKALIKRLEDMGIPVKMYNKKNADSRVKVLNKGIKEIGGNIQFSVEEIEKANKPSEKVTDRIESLFVKAAMGDFSGKPERIGSLTTEGRDYLNQLTGWGLKEDVDFVLNPSDLRHIYNEHYGANEKDPGNNIPLSMNDIRRIVDVLNYPTSIVYGKDIKTDKNVLAFLLDSAGGTHNLFEIYADRRGNLSVKSYYKTKRSAAQRIIPIKETLYSTSETDGATPFGAKIPQMFETAKRNGKNIQFSAEQRSTREDDAYLDALKNGDEETAKAMVEEAARRAGYFDNSDYQGTSAFNGAAPSKNAYFDTKEERREAWDNDEWDGEQSLSDYTEHGIDIADLDFTLNDPRAKRVARDITCESIDNLNKAVKSKKGTITMYRSVPGDIKEKSFRNGDWITPSKAYAEENAEIHGFEKSNIIEQEVSFDDVWWDGNDINEWGYDDCKGYAYKNTENNRKLLDTVTYDKDGNVIPLSQRFNENVSDVHFSIVEDPEEIRKFEDSEKIITYRAMQVRRDRNGDVMKDQNGNPLLYAVMSGKKKGADGVIRWRDPERLGLITKADGDGRNILWDTDPSGNLVAFYNLNKGNGKSVPARYNSHNHTSDSMMNDQFAEAQTRPDVVVVKCEISESDLNSGVRPDWSKDATGPTEWKSGPFEGKLDGINRTVYLTQYVKPVEIVPNQEVAEFIEDRLTRGGVTEIDSNVLHPEVGKILAERGKIKVRQTDNQGNEIGYEKAEALRQKAQQAVINSAKKSSGDIMSDVEQAIYDNRMRTENMQDHAINKYLGGNARVINLRNGELPKEGELVDAVVKTSPSSKLKGTGLKREGDVLAAFGGMIKPGGRLVLRAGDSPMDMEHLQAWAEIHLGTDWVVSPATKSNIGYKDENTIVARRKDSKNLFDHAYDVQFSADEPTGIVLSSDPHVEVMKREMGLGARDRYDARLHTKRHIDQEIVFDYEKPLQTAMDEILKSRGKDPKKDVHDDINIYDAHNHLSSIVNRAQIDFENFFYNPLLKARESVLNGSKSKGDKFKPTAEDLNHYVISRSGLERNVAFAERDAKNAWQPAFEKSCEKLDRERDDLQNTKIPGLQSKVASLQNVQNPTAKQQQSLTDAQDALRNAQNRLNYLQNYVGTQQHMDDVLDNLKDKFRQRDYSGLTGLFKTTDVQLAEALARDMVDDFESKADVTELWDRIHACTAETLGKSLKGGLISQETFDHVSNMMKDYVPLRGWEETTGGDVYNYVSENHNGNGSNDVLKKAKGRGSVADDPFAYMGSMGSSACSTTNRNLVKQKLLNLANSERSDLLSVSKTFFYFNDATGEWEALTPDLSKVTNTADLNSALSQWESDKEMLVKNDPSHYKTAKDMVGIPYKMDPETLGEHQVLVYQNGMPYTVTVNGDPKVAQILNGKLSPDTYDISFLNGVNNFMSRMFTSLSLPFVLRNWARDTETAFLNSLTLDDAASGQLKEELKSIMPLFAMYKSYEKGTLGNSKREVYFKEFLENGGETGYTQSFDIDTFRDKVLDSYKRSLSGKATKELKNVGCVILGGIEYLNQVVENSTRFGQYVASREAGKSIMQSVSNAKNISVNFNRKGGGRASTGKNSPISAKVLGQIYTYFRSTHLFLNPAIQGLHSYYARPFFGRDANAKTRLLAGSRSAFTIVAPFLLRMLCNLTRDDEERAVADEDYFKLPDYERKNNICIPLKRSDDGVRNWLKIPLAQEIAAEWGVGETFYDMIYGTESKPFVDYTKDFVESAFKAMPVDFMQGYSPDEEDTWTRVGTILAPTVVKPWLDISRNRQWTGAPLRRESAWNENDPEYKNVYDSTNEAFVQFCQWLYENTGGEQLDSHGKINMNPANLEYGLKQYIGSIPTVLAQAQNAYTHLTEGDKGDEISLGKRLPVIGTFFTSTSDLNENFAAQREYYIRRHKAAIVKAKLGTLKKDDIDTYADITSLNDNGQNAENKEIYSWYQAWTKVEEKVKKAQDAFYSAKETGDATQIEAAAKDYKYWRDYILSIPCPSRKPFVSWRAKTEAQRRAEERKKELLGTPVPNSDESDD